MRTRRWFALAVLGFLLVACRRQTNESVARAGEPATNSRTFAVSGVVRELKSDGRTVIIEHEAVPDYMPAMTMPFTVKRPEALAGLRAGDEISFRLRVSENESWIEQVTKTGRSAAPPSRSPAGPAGKTQPALSRHPLWDYPFTNELGQAVNLSQFRGQALAITFIFTRCPIPDYCPRLSKNFAKASQQLNAMPNAPTNWHFLSISFDPEFDTPAVLKAYGERHHYDPKHWSFLTGPADKIAELARQSDVNVERAGGLFNHNFRTLIVDAAGHLQMVFPISGNLSDAIAGEMLKAAAVTNQANPP